MDLLNTIQSWYLRQCDGDWEHSYGVTIDTLDNPGWSLKVDLEGTSLRLKPFERVRLELSEQNWFHCSVENGAFLGYGGPNNLGDLLATFLAWSESETPPDVLNGMSE